MARTYKRDSRGRFAGGGGGSVSRGAGKKAGGGKGGSRKSFPTEPVTVQKASKARGYKIPDPSSPAVVRSNAIRAAMRKAASAKSFSELQSMDLRIAQGGAKRGASSGPRGGKVGTKTEQRRNAKAQAARTKAFSSKAPMSNAKAAYKAATSRVRFERAARAAGGSTKSQVKKAQSAVTRMRRTRGR